MYEKVNAGVVAALREIVGADNVLTSAEEMEPYSHDEVIGLRADPEVVVRVTSTQQVSEILHLAQRERVPVTPRGAGMGLSGGAVPVHGGIVLSLEKMDRILEIDKENLMVTVEPGVITGDLHRAVEAEGLFYPPDPASLDSCSIGGNIAEDAGGPRAVKYGVTQDYVCGLEAVLPSGEIIFCGGKLVKNVTGYNLVKLLVGSEGTLAVVTKIILRLLPRPKVQVDLLVPYDDLQAAADTVSDIIAHRIVPATIEFMERDSLRAVERLLQRELPFNDAAAFLLIQLDGNSQQAVDVDYEVVGDLCLKHGARDVLVARDQRTRDRLWEARRLIIDALNHESPANHMEDVVVPRAEVPRFLRGVTKIAERRAVRMVSFGHAGDGNVHVNVLKDEISDDRWEALAPAVSEEIYQLSLSLGGTLTGEHGIGATRRRYLPMALDEAQINVMRGIKAVFDPNQILNPGKIFP
jgi:glycolate oxidase